MRRVAWVMVEEKAGPRLWGLVGHSDELGCHSDAVGTALSRVYVVLKIALDMEQFSVRFGGKEWDGSKDTGQRAAR